MGRGLGRICLLNAFSSSFPSTKCLDRSLLRPPTPPVQKGHRRPPQGRGVRLTPHLPAARNVKKGTRGTLGKVGQADTWLAARHRAASPGRAPGTQSGIPRESPVPSKTRLPGPPAPGEGTSGEPEASSAAGVSSGRPRWRRAAGRARERPEGPAKEPKPLPSCNHTDHPHSRRPPALRPAPRRLGCVSDRAP